MKRHPSCLLFLFTLLFFALPVAASPHGEHAAEKTLSPYFFVEGSGAPGALPLEATNVEVAIAGAIAEVTVTQRYVNQGKVALNAKYVFPASTRAAVHALRMKVGNRIVTAKIKERAAAAQEYEAAKHAGKNAALLEQDRPNVFTMKLANVMPGDRIDVTLQYTELLVPTEGSYEFVYPTVVGPRYSNVPDQGAAETSRFVATPYLRPSQPSAATFSLSGSIATAVALQAVESPTHKLRVSAASPTLSRFVLEDGSRGARDVILRYRLSGDSIHSGLSLYDAGDEKFFVLVLQPPRRVAPELVPPREYVFVVDVSGSMEGFPLATAKRTLRDLVAKLRPIDSFDVILFSGASHLVFPKPVPATPANVTAALSALDAERGGGGTELLPALEQAMNLSRDPNRSRSFVVVTDGYIEADKQAIDYVRRGLGRANVFAFGIGSSVNRYLIEGLAKAGAGEPFVVTDPAEGSRAAARFNDYVAAPVLTRVRVDYQGFDAYDVEPKAVPDVFAERPVVVRGKWRGVPAGSITVSGANGSGAFSQRIEVARITPQVENRALRYLWARERIASLSDYGLGEPSEQVKSVVTGLGLKYGLLTQYTSFIAVSEVVRNPGAGATDVTQPVALPDGVSTSAVGGELAEAPEPELVLIALMAAALAGVLMQRSRLRSFAS